MFLYFINQKGTNNYKIGISKNPEKRLKQLQLGSGIELELIDSFEVDNPRKLEKYLHDKLKVKIKNRQVKLDREWFQIEPVWLNVILFELKTKELDKFN